MPNVKSAPDIFERYLEHWLDRRGTTGDAERAVIRAVAWEFFNLGHDAAVMRIHATQAEAARGILGELLDEQNRMDFGL